MKEFNISNKMTYNLMSFTAFKAMLIFSILLDGPKTYEEIKVIYLSQEYMKETFSIDTLRVYINSLERIGCEIVRGKKSEGSKYKLIKHPFELNITDEYAKQLIKAYKAISKNISLEDLISITNFFNKISIGINNIELKNEITNLSPITKLDKKILDFLINACKNKDVISVSYYSPSPNLKTIDIRAEELFVKNEKVYLLGESPSYSNKANLLVSRIKDLPITKINEQIESKSEMIIECEIYDKNIQLENNERLISEKDGIRQVEIKSDNIFRAKQRVLSLGKQWKVIAPENFKKDIISTLKDMQEEYFA